jgi:hypothetical protein
MAPTVWAEPVFDCSKGFATSGPCGVAGLGAGGAFGSQTFQLVGGAIGATPGLTGSQVDLLPVGIIHSADGMSVAAVDIRAFTTTFTFVPNGWNFSLVFNNSNNNGFGLNGRNFISGATGEGGFYQGYSVAKPPNNVFALMFDSFNALTDIPPWDPTGFINSSAQIYISNPFIQCPTNTGQGGAFCTRYINKLSTAPVVMNSPANVRLTTTGHAYTATVTYNGSNFRLHLIDDVTHDVYNHTWTKVNIPASVGGSNTAFATLMGSNGGSAVSFPLFVNGWSFYPAPLGNRATNGTRSRDLRGGKWQTNSSPTKISNQLPFAWNS